jgi:NADH:ubiquinone oxidoreductase subunit H
MRALFFSIIAEASISLSLYVFYVLDYFSFFSIKDIAITQIFINNIFIIGIFFFFIFIINNLLDSLRIPFDYLECESELVAGIVTEFSGFFFVLYSLMEINHILLNSLLITTLIFGGFYITLKSLLILIFIFLFPRAFGCRLKITTAQTFILTFLYTINFLFFI